MGEHSAIYELEGQIIDKLEALKIEEDSVIVLRVEDQRTGQAIRPFAEELKELIASRYGYPNPLILILAEGVEIETLDEEKMGERGWIKDPGEESPFV